MSNYIEPAEAFPYKRPSQQLLDEYRHLELLDSIPLPIWKLFVDKISSILALCFCLPFLIVYVTIFLFEYMFSPKSRGPMLYWYWAYSQGRRFKKYKFRTFKWSELNFDFEPDDWRRYSVEWDEKNRTLVGRFVKNFYLDEVPQFFCILKGEMSLVGPRPLSSLHYHRDLDQGNYTRRLLRGGLVGYGHVHKGSPNFGRPDFEFIYADIMTNGTSWEQCKTDASVVFQASRLFLRGQGL
jgi:lipopolysaccharide/colanic/teichoic acid biosynthesis glycosyltransferase